mmetsp:Transcript_40800/g.65533  ORF Transcript_40800/g.65533 Transcript_40800/m.65533 type:complete len:243 (-) Transcript_40800:559-1287(-)
MCVRLVGSLQMDPESKRRKVSDGDVSSERSHREVAEELKTTAKVRKRTCKKEECTKPVRAFGVCSAHGGRPLCKEEKCKKRDVGRGKCKAHGGGRRCEEKDCKKSAAVSGYCVKHGKKLAQSLLANSVVDSTPKDIPPAKVQALPPEGADSEDKLTKARGVRKCKRNTCSKRDVGGGKCTTHGGGKRCSEKDCTTKAVGKSGFCTAHGGGRRCHEETCSKLDVGKGFCFSKYMRHMVRTLCC